MQLVFSEMLYVVVDGDIVWDYQFDDQVRIDVLGYLVFDFKVFNKLRFLKDEEEVGNGGQLI